MNIYEDSRSKENDKKTGEWRSGVKFEGAGADINLDLMEDWDEEKLRNVVNQNQQKQKNATDVSQRTRTVRWS